MKKLECTKCGEIKPMTLEYFPLRTDRGKTIFRKHCRVCIRKRNKIKHERRKDKIREYQRERWNNDTMYRMRKLLSRRIREIINGPKSDSISNIIGCDWNTFQQHMESQFTEGMSWDNHGYNGWHIDHIIPISSAKTEEEVYKLNHYTNLQPLWAEENMKKSDKIFDFSEIV